MYQFFTVHYSIETAPDEIESNTAVMVADSVQDIENYLAPLKPYTIVIYPTTETNYYKAIEHGEPVAVLTKSPVLPSDLKQMLNDLAGLVQCGGVRSYYDSEESFSVADSPAIFNLFSYVEEVAALLQKNDIKGAEDYIRNYIKFD